MTPYSRMQPELASILINELSSILQSDSELNNNDLYIKQASINSLSIALNLTDIKDELLSTFFCSQNNILTYLLNKTNTDFS